MLPSLPIQSAKKRNKITLFLVRQFERKDQRILVRILHAPLDYKIHDFFKRLESAVMHIRVRFVAISRKVGVLNAPSSSAVLGHHIATKIHFIVVPTDAEVMELFVSEVEPGVALRAPCFIPEQRRPFAPLLELPLLPVPDRTGLPGCCRIGRCAGSWRWPCRHSRS